MAVAAALAATKDLLACTLTVNVSVEAFADSTVRHCSFLVVAEAAALLQYWIVEIEVYYLKQPEFALIAVDGAADEDVINLCMQLADLRAHCYLQAVVAVGVVIKEEHLLKICSHRVVVEPKYQYEFVLFADIEVEVLAGVAAVAKAGQEQSVVLVLR